MSREEDIPTDSAHHPRYLKIFHLSFFELFSLLYQYFPVILISTVLATHFSLTLADKIEIELMLSKEHKDRLRFSSLTDKGAIAKLSGNLSDYVKLYGQIRVGTQNPPLHIPAFFLHFLGTHEGK